MSTQHSFERLQSLPIKCHYETPKPLFYPKNSNCIIISTSFKESGAGIYKLNLITNRLELLYKYDNSILQLFCNHGQFINSNILCIFGGGTHFFMYDLNTKSKMKDQNFCAMSKLKSLWSPESVHILSEKIDQIHVVQNKTHLKYDCKNGSLTDVTADINCNQLNIQYPKLVYSEYTEKLMILGSDNSDSILTFDINEWKVNKEITMPCVVDDVRDYSVISFGDAIIVFYIGDSNYYDIWCLDLLCYQWFKSNQIVPVSVRCWAHFIKDNNNDIHILDFEHKAHFKINIYELFPQEMVVSRRKYYEVLVNGFIKEGQSNDLISNIPFVLKQLILCYFQIFG